MSIISLLLGTIAASILLFSVYNSSRGFDEVLNYIPFKNIIVLYVTLFVLSVLSTIPTAGKIAKMKVMDVFKTAG
ncbi:hypothetical protein J14TS2_50030 [Bacillus sp. J14TS2]|uniref:hypothetical protein n=1 Tax=Bacillus sp. J14TS2 TaxID=2807188 RepID=UPI001B075AA6|nr:hypothetical protein [Bacillus sp. J14TS2]GIN74528.1 hypothetical protein J14TS2_50030 [Bacillus sp. J14TS2]